MNDSVPDILRRLGAALKASRESKNLSQGAVGDRIGREHTAVGRVERGESTHSATLAAIADALDQELTVRPKTQTLGHHLLIAALEAIASGEAQIGQIPMELRMRASNALAWGPDAARAG